MPVLSFSSIQPKDFNKSFEVILYAEFEHLSKIHEHKDKNLRGKSNFSPNIPFVYADPGFSDTSLSLTSKSYLRK